MAEAGLWAGAVRFFAPPELLSGRTQRPNKHRFHYYTITRTIKDVLRILGPLPITENKAMLMS